MPDISVRGAEQLEKLGKQLRAAGDKDLRRETLAGLRAATKPIRAAIREYDLRHLPQRGGLNRVMARSRITTQVRTSGRNPGIRMATKTHDPRIDQGRLWHPVFGHRDRKLPQPQRIEPGYFSTPASQAAPAVQAELVKAIKRVERQLGRR